MSATVFVSHASADRELVREQIVELLHSHGIETWFASHDIPSGAVWEKTIRAALRDCDWFLVALTPAAITSDWVHAEVDWAVENRKDRLVPVILQECNPSDLHLKLNRFQHVDFRNDPADARLRLLSKWIDPETLKNPSSLAARAEAAVLSASKAGLDGFHALALALGGVRLEARGDASAYARAANRERLLGNPGTKELAAALMSAGAIVTTEEGGVSFAPPLLLSSWAQLRQWIESNGETLRNRELLEQDFRQWSEAEEADRPFLLLPKGAKLRMGLAFLAQNAAHSEGECAALAGYIRSSRENIRARGKRRIALIVAGLFGLIGAVILTAYVTGRNVSVLMITTTPAGATIFANGKAMGPAPQTLRAFRPGAIQVWAEKGGFASRKQTIEVKAGSVQPLNLEISQDAISRVQAAAPAEGAKLAEAEGSVQIQRGSQTLASSIGMRLYTGDKVQVLNDSRAKIVFADGTQIRLTELSSCEILPDPKKENSVLRLIKGGLFYFSRDAGKDIQIRTRDGIGAARG
jgi:hypothetical protein